MGRYGVISRLIDGHGWWDRIGYGCMGSTRGCMALLSYLSLSAYLLVYIIVSYRDCGSRVLNCIVPSSSLRGI